VIFKYFEKSADVSNAIFNKHKKIKMINKKIIFLLIIFSSVKLFSASEEPNSVFLGFGAEQNLTEHHLGVNLMIGYNRHLETTPEMSVGVLIEGVFGSKNTCIFGFLVGFHPFGHSTGLHNFENLKLYLAPCFVYSSGGKEYFDDFGVEHFRNNNQFMLKFGAGFSVPFSNSKFSVMPFVEGSVIETEFILGIGIKFNMYFADYFR